MIELEGSRYPGGQPSFRGYLEEEWEVWYEQAEQDSGGDVFVLPVAPDRLHKENTSGGSPYGIILPDGCVEGLFVAESAAPLVSYLNQVFRQGGFPWPTGSENEWRIKRELAKDLLPL